MKHTTTRRLNMLRKITIQVSGRMQAIESDSFRPRAHPRLREAEFCRDRRTSTSTTTTVVTAAQGTQLYFKIDDPAIAGLHGKGNKVFGV